MRRYALFLVAPLAAALLAACGDVSVTNDEPGASSTIQARGVNNPNEVAENRGGIGEAGDAPANDNDPGGFGTVSTSAAETVVAVPEATSASSGAPSGASASTQGSALDTAGITQVYEVNVATDGGLGENVFEVTAGQPFAMVVNNDSAAPLLLSLPLGEQGTIALPVNTSGTAGADSPFTGTSPIGTTGEPADAIPNTGGSERGEETGSAGQAGLPANEGDGVAGNEDDSRGNTVPEPQSTTNPAETGDDEDGSRANTVPEPGTTTDVSGANEGEGSNAGQASQAQAIGPQTVFYLQLDQPGEYTLACSDLTQGQARACSGIITIIVR